MQNCLNNENSGFKKTINSNKYQPKVSTERISQYLDFLIDPSFQGVYRLLSLFLYFIKKSKHRILFSNSRNKIFPSYDSWKFFFDHPVKGDMGKYENIPKITTGQGDDYTAP